MLLSWLLCSSSVEVGGLVSMHGLLLSGIHPIGVAVGPILTGTATELLLGLLGVLLVGTGGFC